MKTEDQSKKNICRDKIRERLDKRIDRLEKRRDRLGEKSMFGLTPYEIERTYRKGRRLRRKVAEAKFLLFLIGDKNYEGDKHDEESK